MVQWEQVFHVLTTHMVIGVALHTDRFLYANVALQNLLGYSQEDLFTMAIWDLCDEPSRTQIRTVINTARNTLMAVPPSLLQWMDEQPALPSDDVPPIRLHMRTTLGQWLWIDAYVTSIAYQDMLVSVINFLDVSHQVQLLAQVEQDEQRFHETLEAIPLPILIIQDTCLYANAATRQWLGYTDEALRQLRPNDLLADHTADGSLWQRIGDEAQRGRLEGDTLPRVAIRTVSGHQRWARVTMRSIWYHNDWAVLVIAADLTAEVRNERVLQKTTDHYRTLAEIDPLTQLANRRVLDQQLAHHVHGKNAKPSFGLIMVDLDHFKQVNDTWGHDVGDQILQEIADIFRHNVRHQDLLARYGGEEFMILVHASSLDDGILLAERIRNAVSTHNFPVVSHVTVSMGVAMCSPEDTVQSLTRRVDQALYLAKHQGRNCVVTMNS